MEITDENKNEIKDQINIDINNILEKHELPYRMVTEWMGFPL